MFTSNDVLYSVGSHRPTGEWWQPFVNGSTEIQRFELSWSSRTDIVVDITTVAELFAPEAWALDNASNPACTPHVPSMHPTYQAMVADREDREDIADRAAHVKRPVFMCVVVSGAIVSIASF